MVKDAIANLHRRMPAPPLRWRRRLALAAYRLVIDLGLRGGLGHIGADGSTVTVRMRSVGIRSGAMDEGISLMPGAGDGAVRPLIIDDGVPPRGHRMAIFDTHLTGSGRACRARATYGWMCVVDFAGGLVPRRASEVYPAPPGPGERVRPRRQPPERWRRGYGRCAWKHRGLHRRR